MYLGLNMKTEALNAITLKPFTNSTVVWKSLCSLSDFLFFFFLSLSFKNISHIYEL